MGHFVVFSNTALRKKETNMAGVSTHENPLYVAQSMHDFQQIELLNMPIHIEKSNSPVENLYGKSFTGDVWK